MSYVNVLKPNYYNEIDKYAAQWLRNLIAAGHIAPGEVDERSIEDVTPDELRGYRQCHFFAGIGVWSLALRRAGWADDREIWTGSCPCQPFSAAGAGAGFADERHLWPAFHHLIAERRPAKVLGEQVASSHVNPWIDLVQSDLEALGYGFAGVPFPSAGVGAPHIRDRLYWVGHAGGARLGERERERGVLGRARRANKGQAAIGAGVHALRLAHHDGQRLDGQQVLLQPGRPQQAGVEAAGSRGFGWLADDQLQQRSGSAACGDVPGGRDEESAALAGLRSDLRPGPTNGHWRDADWLGCTDGKWRPVEPGSFPLVNGASGRVGRLRAYGNAINAEAARVFIEAVMGCAP